MGLVSLLVIVVACESLSYFALWILPRISDIRAPRTAGIYRDQTRRIAEYLPRRATIREQLDPDLGWRYRPLYARGGDRINSQGLRSLREYSKFAPPGVVRVAAFGDSFVYGNEVDTKDDWPMSAERAHPVMEVLNYGVGGYGDDQAYLRFAREGMDLHPQILALGFSPDDLRRLTNVFRGFVDDREFGWTKPRFRRTASGGLTVDPPPMRDSADMARLMAQPTLALGFGAHDQWFQPMIYRDPLYDYSATIRLVTTLTVRIYSKYFDPNRLIVGSEFNPASEAFGLQLAVTSRFVENARSAGVTAVFVILPDEVSVRRARSGQRTVYSPLTDSLRRRGVDVIDVAAAFVAEPGNADSREWFAPRGHYSPVGNEVVGRAVGSAILQRVSLVK